MSQDDPFAVFGDEDKTIIRPSPGGRRPSPAMERPPPRMPAAGPAVELPQSGGFRDNPVTALAAPLLGVVARLRTTATLPDIAGLRQELVASLRNFQNGILGQGIPQEQARVASYALCALLDETILNTPWGAQSDWSHQTLLVQFHREAWGGENFFKALKGLVQQPAQNLFLLEFFFLCLSLGFEGQYRRDPRGANALEQMRGELFRLIQRVRGDYERELSPRWRGLKDLRPALVRYVPLWVVGAAAAALLALVYLGFLLAISSASDPLFNRISALPVEPPPLVETAGLRPTALSRPTERFRPLLQQEIADGLVEVADDRTLRIHNSFASGSDQVKPEFVPMLKKIAGELDRGGDRATVRGHTDDKPIRSVRFPSNFELSTARARNVAAILEAAPALAGKVRHEGRAEAEPLVPNDTAEHRAMNRRVDILIK